MKKQRFARLFADGGKVKKIYDMNNGTVTDQSDEAPMYIPSIKDAEPGQPALQLNTQMDQDIPADSNLRLANGGGEKMKFTDGGQVKPDDRSMMEKVADMYAGTFGEATKDAEDSKQVNKARKKSSENNNTADSPPHGWGYADGGEVLDNVDQASKRMAHDKIMNANQSGPSTGDEEGETIRQNPSLRDVQKNALENGARKMIRGYYADGGNVADTESEDDPDDPYDQDDSIVVKQNNASPLSKDDQMALMDHFMKSQSGDVDQTVDDGNKDLLARMGATDEEDLGKKLAGGMMGSVGPMAEEAEALAPVAQNAMSKFNKLKSFMGKTPTANNYTPQALQEMREAVNQSEAAKGLYHPDTKMLQGQYNSALDKAKHLGLIK